MSTEKKTFWEGDRETIQDLMSGFDFAAEVVRTARIAEGKKLQNIDVLMACISLLAREVNAVAEKMLNPVEAKVWCEVILENVKQSFKALKE